jgi:hypothetical protein
LRFIVLKETALASTTSPYEGLQDTAFWRSGVQQSDPEAMLGIYSKRFEIKATDRVVTAGSCFAQHIARQLRERGFTVLDAEPPPGGLSEEAAKSFGFKLYSARYGNIYTTRQLLQLVQESMGRFTPADAVWEKDGRFFDAMRPSVEPEGLDSPEEVRAHREQHLRAVRRLWRECDILVFTLGLTEAWMDRESGTVYPTAPGTIAGRYDPERHVFRNLTFNDIRTDFVQVRRFLKRVNPEMRFLLTVSPVPLTATAAGGGTCCNPRSIRRRFCGRWRGSSMTSSTMSTISRPTRSSPTRLRSPASSSRTCGACILPASPR